MSMGKCCEVNRKKKWVVTAELVLILMVSVIGYWLGISGGKPHALQNASRHSGRSWMAMIRMVGEMGPGGRMPAATAGGTPTATPDTRSHGF